MEIDKQAELVIEGLDEDEVEPQTDSKLNQIGANRLKSEVIPR